LNGLDLVWNSDFVVSGGGTMNREAAALGVPVYSVFRGRIGAVDKYLSETGRLVLLGNVEDVRSRIQLSRRAKKRQPNVGDSMALKQIMATIDEVIARSCPASVESA
jgi:predicted glycosyltransferase